MKARTLVESLIEAVRDHDADPTDETKARLADLRLDVSSKRASFIAQLMANVPGIPESYKAMADEAAGCSKMPRTEPWRVERDHDSKHGTHRLTNGRAQLSIWVAELADPELRALEEQLQRGAAPTSASSSSTSELNALLLDLAQRAFNFGLGLLTGWTLWGYGHRRRRSARPAPPTRVPAVPAPTPPPGPFRAE